ncbi:MAG: PD-(D/E)XK nuclease family protein [Bacteroidales bacterium]|nr:PD-(D/E)XK nuclease family protein [Bacteroidales bacterium]
MDFLKSVAKYYIEKKGENNDWSDLCFVFPSHRAGVFFRNALQSLVGERVLFGAHIVTLDDFIVEKSKELKEGDGNGCRIKKADNITLAFELYLAYKEIMSGEKIGEDGIDASDFDRFYSWAPMFLGDFDDADKYMVDTQGLFSNVAAYEGKTDDLSHLSERQRAVIEAFWGVKFTEVTEHDLAGGEDQKTYYYERFIETYEKLNELYERFNERLSEKGLAYSGHLYRKVAEMYQRKEQAPDDMHYAFIGFNALTKAEQLIFDSLNLKEGRAEFFWDYPEEIVAPIRVGGRDVHLEHGPGRFIREFKDRYKSPIASPDREGERDINIVKYAYPQGQVAHIGKFVKSLWSADKQLTSRTAIVLTDENMLLPVLSALPQKSDGGTDMGYDINITMGYPLKFSQVYGLLDLLVRFQREAMSNEGNSFYYKAVVPLLQHQWIHNAAGDDAANLLASIVRENKIRVEKSEFESNELLKEIFRHVAPEEVSKYVQDIFIAIHKAAIESQDGLSAECAYKVVKVATRFAELLEEYINNDRIRIPDNNSGLVMSMLDSLVKQQTVDFHSDSLSGMQIMGILETRAVDFDNLVVLDLNEGVFPKKNASMTFIPYVIRKAFDMPTHEFQDSIFSYYFFRLINRAKNVHLLYAESNDANRQGVSRFVQQIKYQFNYKYTEKVAVHELNILPEDTREITKTSQVVKELKTRFCRKLDPSKKGGYMSPSALANYLFCPIKFYISNVLKIDDLDEVAEEADSRTIGSIFHNVMEELYNQHIKPGGTFDDGVRKRLLSGHVIEDVVRVKFAEELKLKGDFEGRNIIFDKVVCKLVEMLIKKEEAPFIFVAAEEECRTEMSLDGDLNVNVGGIIDRQHITDGTHYVIDYKTGSTGVLDIPLAEGQRLVDKLFDYNDENHDKYKAVLQTMMYCMMLYDKAIKEGKSDVQFKIGVIYLKALLGSMKLEYEAKYHINHPKTNGKSGYDKECHELVYNEQLHNEFKAKLKEVLEEIFGDKPFVCRDKSKCDNRFTCQFYSVCYRPKSSGQ